MSKTLSIIVVTLLLSLGAVNSYAGYNDARKHYYSRSNKSSYKSLFAISRELTKSGLYFAAVPFLKEYLVRFPKFKSDQLDRLVERLVDRVGIRQFEVMPINVLARINTPTIRYVLSKKLFRQRKFKAALKELRSGIPMTHSIKPFALMITASIETILKQHKDAAKSYQICIARSNLALKKGGLTGQKKRQLTITRDYCLVGVARSTFSYGNYQDANLNYLDLEKGSHIWPEILFEEAWNSFYLKDYNRTLGKLVTYKAPIFTHIVNPEIEVLKALTYLELCLWDDARNAVDTFYNKHKKKSDQLIKYVKNHYRDYRHFYLLTKSRTEGAKGKGKIIDKIVESIIRDPAYGEMLIAFQGGRDEFAVLKSFPADKFKKEVKSNLQSALLLQRDLIGAYAQKVFRQQARDFKKMLVNMSYIKLEVLSRRKSDIYMNVSDTDGKRGDFQHLLRNEKQYFWNFNGEFWADELGDYVFALRSECRQ
ncbi:MAG: hypothetical protein HN353_02995 [Bdellovibrionales bacterium]|nr:hypothetical protein [Bdellovibrionales bacterium]MBT3527127.1 hypothetical protein [Bdellovibrionales bacterium]MBT7668108.1 hypothetical protein [Bdellovibrionales bacterium]MBT7766160.1 hypothetical protein [Bdellovibrionales bacterium]